MVHGEQHSAHVFTVLRWIVLRGSDNKTLFFFFHSKLCGACVIKHCWGVG